MDVTRGVTKQRPGRPRGCSALRSIARPSVQRHLRVAAPTHHAACVSLSTLATDGVTSAAAGVTPASYRAEHSIRLKGIAPDTEDSIFAPLTDFETLSFQKPLKSMLTRAGYSAPTPIQAQAWPIAMQGRDMISVAKTGSGKTCAYLLPAINQLMTNKEQFPERQVSVLVLCPTRELCNQIMDQVSKYTNSAAIGVRALACFGGSNRFEQIRALNRGNVQVLVGTPGRCNDLMEAGVLNLSKVRYVVLDEADRMLDMGFEPQISDLLRGTDASIRQTLCFTATWPKEVQRLALSYLRDPVQVNIGESDQLTANPGIVQNIKFVSEWEKMDALDELLTEVKAQYTAKMESDGGLAAAEAQALALKQQQEEEEERRSVYSRMDGRGGGRYGSRGGRNQRDRHGDRDRDRAPPIRRDPKVLIFTSRKASCDDIVYFLAGKGYTGVNSLHGDKTQGMRDRVMTSFRKGYCSYLVATDVAARGLDISDIDVVVNIDMPSNIEDYVHRIGRTARGANAHGLAYTFFSFGKDYRLARDLVGVMERSKQEIPEKLAEYVAQRQGRGQRQGGGRGGSRGGGGRFQDSRGRGGYGGGYGGGGGRYSRERSSSWDGGADRDRDRDRGDSRRYADRSSGGNRGFDGGNRSFREQRPRSYSHDDAYGRSEGAARGGDFAAQARSGGDGDDRVVDLTDRDDAWAGANSSRGGSYRRRDDRDSFSRGGDSPRYGMRMGGGGSRGGSYRRDPMGSGRSRSGSGYGGNDDSESLAEVYFKKLEPVSSTATATAFAQDK